MPSICEFCRALVEDAEPPAHMLWCQRGPATLGLVSESEQMEVREQLHEFTRPRYSSAGLSSPDVDEAEWIPSPKSSRAPSGTSYRSSVAKSEIGEEFTVKARAASSATSTASEETSYRGSSIAKSEIEEEFTVKARGASSATSTISEEMEQPERTLDGYRRTDSDTDSATIVESVIWSERPSTSHYERGRIESPGRISFMPRWRPTIVRELPHGSHQGSPFIQTRSKKCSKEHRHVFTVTARNW